MEFGKRIKAFDIYRKLPTDLSEPTTSGALVSIIATVIMLLLFISELRDYIALDERSEMFVAGDADEKKIRVNLDIEFPKFPCDIFSLDAQDIMGTH